MLGSLWAKKHVFSENKALSLPGAILFENIFQKNYENKEAAVAAKRPWPRSGQNSFAKSSKTLEKRQNLHATVKFWTLQAESRIP